MSLSDFAIFGKKLLFLNERVDGNAEEIKALRQDLKALTDFTQRVAYAVKKNQESENDKNTILVQRLENELLRLENRLLSSSQNSIQGRKDDY